MEKKGKCAVCGGKVVEDKINDKYTCSKCKAAHDPALFNPAKKSIKNKKYRVRWIVAIIGSIYLLWLIYRVFMY